MFVNLTPHVINIVSPTGETIISLPPCGQIARVASRSEAAGNIEGVSLLRVTFGNIEGLPLPADGVVYVCSALVRGATTRTDVASPGDLVRGADGQPVGCKGLVIN